MDKHIDLPPAILSVYKDIQTIKIQGATNVAIATFDAVIKWLFTTRQKDPDKLIERTFKFLVTLATARKNEPLAKNGVKFVKHKISQIDTKKLDVFSLRKLLIEASKEYLNMIAIAKQRVIMNGLPLSDGVHIILTHCHSSTAESLIEAMHKIRDITVIATETRPRYQGHITAKNLIKHSVKTYMIVDGAAPFFIQDDSFLPVDLVFVGSDEINRYGDALNKVGTYSIGLASKTAGKPLYIVTPSLKLNYDRLTHNIDIERRSGKEVWPDAPKGLEIINFAFDFIPNRFITGFITELGILKPEDLATAVVNAYPWVKKSL